MQVYTVRNAHEALAVLLSAIDREGVERQSRNGPVLMFPMPITICYEKPTERVLFWPERDANPFFHFFEALHMLAGRNDVAFPAYFAKQILEYSDDGTTLHGAYGHRWRKAFKFDQLREIVTRLRQDPNCRRQVLQMWHAGWDLGRDGKDLPCNIAATFQINVNGQLDMVMFNRSNDTIWGAVGANVVHFSVLQEYVAGAVGVPVGRYWQVSANMHVYKNDVYTRCRPIAAAEPDPWRWRNSNPYDTVQPFDLFTTDHIMNTKERWFLWDVELDRLFSSWQCPGAREFTLPFFRDVAVPMLQAYHIYKTMNRPKCYTEAKDRALKRVAAMDWQRAGGEWIMRRFDKWVAGVDVGV